MLSHNVYFALKDNSESARQKLLADCGTYLTSHPGIVSIACGTVEPELARPVNVRDFDVSLHILFESKAAHDAYQDAPRHHQFVEANQHTWAKVRVFDSQVEAI